MVRDREPLSSPALHPTPSCGPLTCQAPSPCSCIFRDCSVFPPSVWTILAPRCPAGPLQTVLQWTLSSSAPASGKGNSHLLLCGKCWLHCSSPERAHTCSMKDFIHGLKPESQPPCPHLFSIAWSDRPCPRSKAVTQSELGFWTSFRG